MSRWFVHCSGDHFYLKHGDTGAIASETFADLEAAFEHASLLNTPSVTATLSEAGQGMAALSIGHPDVSSPNGDSSATDVSPDRPLSRHARYDD